MESINDFMPNSNDWNSERLQTLKQLYPDWFTNEGNLNIDEIKKAVNPELVNELQNRNVCHRRSNPRSQCQS